MAQPNILLIVTDQQRHESVNGGGGIPWSAPRLRQLAVEGSRFENAYTVCALCSPARASILTGLYPHNHGMWRNCDMFQYAAPDLPDRVRVISQDLSDAGYACGYVGKWHAGTNRMPSHYGFEGMDVPGYGDPYATPEYKAYLEKKGLQPAERVPAICQYGDTGEPLDGVTRGDEEACASCFLAEETIDHLKRYADGDKPFFLVFSLWDPHSPFMPPESWAERFSPDDVELPATLREAFGADSARGRWKNSFYPITASMTDEQWQQVLSHCCAQTAFMDAQIGRVLDALDELGLTDHTAVMATSDHGDSLGAHGGQFDKGPFMYEEIYRIPMIVRYPGNGTAGSVCGRLVTNMDAASTALDMAGCLDRDLDSRSLVPLLEDAQADWPDDVVCETHGHRFPCSNRMVRFGKYKYVFNSMEPEELYDLEADPDERRNLAADPEMKTVRDEGVARLVRNMRASGDPVIGAVTHLSGTLQTP